MTIYRRREPFGDRKFEYEGPDKSLERAREVGAEVGDRKQERKGTLGGRKLPSLEEERPAGSKEKRLGERRT